jgi:AmmeMemoRadiSam system protein B
MFYPDNPVELRRSIEGAFINTRIGPGRLPPAPRRRKIFGIVSPHAGYIFSGAVAAHGFYEISSQLFENVVMVGPNHYGIGSSVAMMHQGIWETPIGQTEINEVLAQKISKNSGIIDFDNFAHSKDHCLEVQLPFLQYLNKSAFKIVPIILILQGKETAMQLGSSIADSIADDENTILVASSDFTHYEPNEEAHRKDNELIKAILDLDITKFYTVLQRLNVSACGYGAIASIITAVKEMGATRGELLKYATSGDVTGDTNAVVGYSSIIFT